MGLREIKAAARAALHEQMKVPAYYYAAGAGDPVSCYIRVHTKLNQMQGDLKGTSFSYAETEQHVPKLLFWVTELSDAGITLARGDVLMVSASEGYKLDHSLEPDIHSIYWKVGSLTASQRAAFSYPGA
jgi:hypothetical protein